MKCVSCKKEFIPENKENYCSLKCAHWRSLHRPKHKDDDSWLNA